MKISNIMTLLLLLLMVGCATTVTGTNHKLTDGRLNKLVPYKTNMVEVKKIIGAPMRVSPRPNIDMWNSALLRMDKSLPIGTEYMWIYEKITVNALGTVRKLTTVLLFDDDGLLLKSDTENK